MFETSNQIHSEIKPVLFSLVAWQSYSNIGFLEQQFCVMWGLAGTVPEINLDCMYSC